MTLEVSLDEQPKEFSWVVMTLNDGGATNNQVVASLPTGFYTGYSKYTFQHRLQVKSDQFYKVSLRDSFGDGLKGYVAAYRGSVAILGNLIMYEPLFYEADSSDLTRVEHAFYAGRDPPNYLSLAINLVKYPMVRCNIEKVICCILFLPDATHSHSSPSLCRILGGSSKAYKTE